MKITSEQLTQELEKYTGSSKFYEHAILDQRIFMTEGVHYVCEITGAYWLIDILLSFQWKANLSNEAFQVWTLRRVKENSYVIIATDGNGKLLARHRIPFSDFPLDKITLWLVDDVCLLPNEY